MEGSSTTTSGTEEGPPPLHDSGYGYGGKLGDLRREEFSRLDGSRDGEAMTYLDHGGATLYGEAQLKASMEEMCGNVYANPHSQSVASQRTSKTIEKARRLVLKHLNANPSEYTVVFTAGATAGLKLLGECFPWSEASEFCYTLDNHNSVLGMREYAKQAGASVRVVDEDSPDSTLAFINPPAKEKKKTSSRQNAEGKVNKTYSLFAFPAESNFSGRKVDLKIIDRVKSGTLPQTWATAAAAAQTTSRIEKAPHKSEEEDSKNNNSTQREWLVCVDAAKFCATDTLDLRKHPADFVSLSLYKIIGHPTGLGALVVRNDRGGLLKKRYFGGGTVEAAVSDGDFWRERKDLSERLEDGTVSFLSICSIRHGFDVISRLGGMGAVRSHVRALTAYLFVEMAQIKHECGDRQPLCEIYGYPKPKPGESRHSLFLRVLESELYGSVVSFNMRDANGEWIGYSAVEQLAGVFNIQIRTGCFCNPGACQKYLSLSKEMVKSNLEAGHVCWDSNDVMDGKPTGAVRVSLGYMSTKAEVDRWLSFLRTQFVRVAQPAAAIAPSIEEEAKYNNKKASVKLKRVILYPVKSCGGMEVEEWSIGRTGLLYDRHWAIVNAKGVALTQKRVPEMTQILPKIDLKRGVLELHHQCCERPLVVPLNEDLVASASDSGTGSGSGWGSGVVSYLFGAGAGDGSGGGRVGGSRNRLRETRVCSTNCQTTIESNADAWLERVLGQPCSLARIGHTRRARARKRLQNKRDLRKDKTDVDPASSGAELSFANEGQFLLVSESSVSYAAQKMEENKRSGAEGGDISIDYKRFRPNFLMSGAAPFEEDGWEALSLACSDPKVKEGKLKSGEECDRELRLRVTGPCVRCQMVDRDQETGMKKSPLLRTLAGFRKKENQIVFGVLLEKWGGPESENIISVVRVGDVITPLALGSTA